MNRIFPNWDQIEKFRQPLTDGEKALALFLDDNLHSSWQIYVQPHLNGDKPDIVILNPKIGVVIFEVKDWNADLYYSKMGYYFDKESNNSRKIWQFFVKSSRGEQQIPSPVSQVSRYRDNLLGIYLPSIGEAIDKNSNELAPFKTAIYFHNATTKQAKSLVDVKPKRCAVFGSDSLRPDRLIEVVTDCKRVSSKFMREDWADKIQFFLKPPFHTVEQGMPLKLSSTQQRHAQPDPGKHQRLRGVAGSGKTLVLAQRTASLASQGKRVLVVYFNITLGAYIRDHIARARYGFGWDLVDIIHFHGFCKNYLSENDERWPQGDVEHVMNELVPTLVKRTVRSGKNAKLRCYDAVLVDEGQDFCRSWYDTLCCFLNDSDEFLLVRDERQNIYARDPDWADTQVGTEIKTKFRGQWRVLETTYRLQLPLIRQVRRFASEFLKSESQELRQAENRQTAFEFASPRLIWREIANFNDACHALVRGALWLMEKQGVHPQDIVILTTNHYEGETIVEAFAECGMQANHVFGGGDSDQSRYNKRSFQMGDGRIKICTVHSFKGWELVNVLLLTPEEDYQEAESTEDLDKLMYTAITRARQNLIVYNRHPRYREYGKGWPSGWKQEN
jgi:hypothetical protein